MDLLPISVTVNIFDIFIFFLKKWSITKNQKAPHSHKAHSFHSDAFWKR